MVTEIVRSGRDIARCLLVFTLVTVAVALIRGFHVPRVYILIPTLWAMGALLPGWREQFPPPAVGLSVPHLKEGIKLFLLTSLIIFPLYCTVFYLFIRLGFPKPVALVPSGVKFIDWIIYQYAVISFTEELFFRGFVQGRFENWAKTRFISHGAVFWIPILVSAFLFALAHLVVYLDPLRLAVFFPGLLFGWLRAKTDSLLAPILSHGTANLVSMVLIGSVS